MSSFEGLVPMGDAAALAATMAESLTATHETAAPKARAQDFSIDRVAERYLELLFSQTSSGARK